MMRRFLALLLVAVLVLSGWTSRALARTSGSFDMNAVRAIELLNEEKYVEVREIAQKMLAADSASPMGNYLMGAVYARGEGSLPRAHYYLSLARKALEAPFREGFPLPGQERLHAMTMLELIEVTAEMDRYEEQLHLLELYDNVYGPALGSWYGWPLMKLGRMSEARARTALALTSPDEPNRTRALNTLGAIESTDDHAQASYDVFVGLVDEVKRKHWDLQAAFLCNAGEAGLILGRFDDAEHYFLEGAQHFDSHSYSDPWEMLAPLYAGEGRLPEAIQAVKEMHRWSRARVAALEQQSWAFEQQVSATVMMALGYDDAALSLLRRVLDRPDRRGAVTGQADQSEAGLLLTFRHALKLHQEELAEEMSWLPARDWLGNWWSRLRNDREIWEAGSRVAALTARYNRLEWSLRPYAVDSSVVEWIRPDMGEVLGEGVTEAEVNKMLARTGPDAQREQPYLLLIKGQCELHRWAFDAARQDLEQALARIPSAEVLLRARVEALLSVALQHRGDSQAALMHLEQAMQRSPGVVRALGMSIPVSISASSDAACQEAVAMLDHSPRFRNTGAGFAIKITLSGNQMVGTLLSPENAVLCEVQSPRGTDGTQSARDFCKAFHAKAFASQLDLSQTDITSLDGSNQSGDSTRQQLQQLFAPGASPGTAAP